MYTDYRILCFTSVIVLHSYLGHSSQCYFSFCCVHNRTPCSVYICYNLVIFDLSTVQPITTHLMQKRLRWYGDVCLTRIKMKPYNKNSAVHRCRRCDTQRKSIVKVYGPLMWKRLIGEKVNTFAVRSLYKVCDHILVCIGESYNFRNRQE